MKLMLFLILFQLESIKPASNGHITALTDEQYDIMIRKVRGEFDKPLGDRNSVEKNVIRKYYRWLSQGKDIYIGPSGKTIYINGKQLIQKEELNQAISHARKETKDAGIRKLTQRMKTRFVGCSERKIVSAKADNKCLKVNNSFYYFL